MNILYCGDENIEEGLIISIISILKNIKEELKVYVLTINNIENENIKIKGISESYIDFLDKRVKKENKNNFVKKIDITDLFIKEIPVKNLNTRFSPCCMLRLFADEIKEIPDKILYLDTDVVCRQDFTEFYNQDIANYELVGVLDYYGKWFFNKNIKNIFKFNYINSGVLLLNMAKIKETKLFEKCRKMCVEKKMFMPDQSAINKLVTLKKIAPRKYNEQRKMHKDTVLQHFTTSFRFFPWFHALTIKPWNIDRVHKELKIRDYDSIFEEYTNVIQTLKSNQDKYKKKNSLQNKLSSNNDVLEGIELSQNVNENDSDEELQAN